MLRNQQQASTIDLSQSAYDSAQAGVEDAKRAILHYQSLCSQPVADQVACDLAKSQIDDQKCNSAMTGLSDLNDASSDSQVKIQNNSGNALDQAYTCTTIILDTPDYVGTLEKDTSEIIPLIGTNSIDSVQIKWFTKANYPSGNPFLSAVGVNPPLLPSWSQNAPPILRVQLIQFGSNGFSLDNFIDKNSSNQSDTIFLYPSRTGINQYAFATDVRRDVNPTSPGSPKPVSCSEDLTSQVYSCSVKLTLPILIGAGNRTAFLRLTAVYNSATYQVSLISSNNVVNFNGVQPIIDSTGRASDMFRRVKARVKLNSDFPYPNAEIFTSGNFCKNFLVTDTNLNNEFATNNPVTCTP
jgi:hypothetical protein